MLYYNVDTARVHLVQLYLMNAEQHLAATDLQTRR